MAIYERLGLCMLRDQEFCVDVWSALTNTVWRRGGEVYLYSFRAAGDLIAELYAFGVDIEMWPHYVISIGQEINR